MIDQDRETSRDSVAIATDNPSCTFCGRPDGRPIHGLSEISVCDRCLRTACGEMLHELNELDRL
ncbi:MAG TPA: hypothetical protein VII47_03420 [Actinomycetota bacterium]|jgi:hypothetical protein